MNKRLEKKPLFYAVSGVKNSGKTTLITKLLPILTGRGLKVATIKHDGHDFQTDVPGTDTFAHFQAGAYGTVVFSDHKYMVVKQQPDEVVAEKLTPEQMAAAGELALRLHRALGLQVYSRTDMILDGEGNLWCLEINSLPGMTPASFVPKEAAAVGMSYNQLCEEIVRLSYEIQRKG